MGLSSYELASLKGSTYACFAIFLSVFKWPKDLIKSFLLTLQAIEPNLSHSIKCKRFCKPQQIFWVNRSGGRERQRGDLLWELYCFQESKSDVSQKSSKNCRPNILQITKRKVSTARLLYEYIAISAILSDLRQCLML